MSLHENKEQLTSGLHISYWVDSVVAPIRYEKLQADIKTDVVIVGGGIAGLTIAYCLATSGKRVAVVEDGFIGSGETGRTTAHLVTALDDRYYELEKVFGEEKARLAANSHRIAIDFVESVIALEKIECDFERVDGYLFRHPSDDEDVLDKELEATLRMGLEVEKTDTIPGLIRPGIPALKFLNQAQFHPLLYLQGLSKAILGSDGRIFTETHAKDIDEKGIVSDDGFRIQASHVVVATNTPVNDRFAIHMKQFPYRTYVIGSLVPKGSLPHALWWDTGDYNLNAEIPPYHYVRLHPYDDNYDLLISGGEDHPTGLAGSQDIPEEERYTHLENWTKEHFPIGDIMYKWSGQVMEPADSLAFIGRNPWDKDNVYIVTGDSGNGMTHGTIAGILISDLINGKENKWESLYNPSRLKIKSTGRLLKEFVSGFIAYLKENPKHTDAIELSSINMDEGKIVTLNKEKFGVYRDRENIFHMVSAECTHLKCIIAWNNDEKSWDCPCHGSRFTYEGRVINGPANEDLFYHKEYKTDVQKIIRR